VDRPEHQLLGRNRATQVVHPSAHRFPISSEGDRRATPKTPHGAAGRLVRGG
jgi:hypothetical protein